MFAKFKQDPQILFCSKTSRPRYRTKDFRDVPEAEYLNLKGIDDDF